MQVIKKIGEGSFAEVFLVRENDQDFVKKVYKSGCNAEARRENLFLSAVNNKYIPHVIEFTESNQEAILLLSYIAGTTLSDTSSEISSEIDTFFYHLSQIIFDFHTAGICLNDIKPDNIIVNNKQPYLIDLGLSTPNMFYDKNFRGTIAYSAPEKIFSQNHHLSGDIFSLGILYLYLISGNTPADLCDKNKYFETLSDSKKWKALLESFSADDFINSLLDLTAIKRPAISKVVRFFAEKTGIEYKTADANAVKSYFFSAQHKAVEQILSQKTTTCSHLDEPELILNQLVLRSESMGENCLILKESELIYENENFLKKKDSFLNDSAAKQTKRIILFRNTPEKTVLFEELSLRKDTNILLLDNVSQLPELDLSEVEEFLSFLSAEEKPVSYSFRKPFALKKAVFSLVSQEHELLDNNELHDLIAYINLPLQITFLAEIMSNWQLLLQDGLLKSLLGIDGDRIISLAAGIRKPSAEIIKSATATAVSREFFLISARFAQLNENSEEAFYFLEKYLTMKINNENYQSALASLLRFIENLDVTAIPAAIIRQKAFLLRMNNQPAKSLEIYTYLENSLSGKEKMIILNDKAVVLLSLGRTQEALDVYAEIVKFFRNDTDTKSLLRAMNNLASANFKLGKYYDAESIYQEMHDLAYKENDKQFTTLAHMNLSDVYLRKGEWKRSLNHSLKASELGMTYKKTLVIVNASIYALQANFALGKYENFAGIAEGFEKDKQMKENLSLLTFFYSSLLPIAIFLAPEIAESFASNLRESPDKDTETIRSLFLFYYSVKNYLEIENLLKCAKENDINFYCREILSGEEKRLTALLGKLILKGDLYLGLLTAAIMKKVRPDLSSKAWEDTDRVAEVMGFEPLSRQLTDNVYQEDSSLRNQLELFKDILTLIHSNEEFDKTIEAVLASVIRIGELERAVYFTFSDSELIPRIALDGNTKTTNPQSVRVSHTILKETIKTGQIMFFSNLQEDIPFDIHSSIFGLGLRTAVCYPLVINYAVKGVIYADARNNKKFTDHEKGFLETVFVQAKSALEKTERIEKLKQEQELIRSSSLTSDYPEIIGNSEPMKRIFLLMRTIADHNVNVLILGPTGSGKELIARALHMQYAPKLPFVAVNCAAIPEQLLESELFGYEKGAFTGAIKDKKGKIELAGNGTLFLDEIGDMPPGLQSKMLRVLQERIFSPVGSNRIVNAQFRLITATNRNLGEMVAEGKFRQDLYFRLKVIQIELPSLNERGDDILLLTWYFIEKFNNKFRKTVTKISPSMLSYLRKKKWQGNIRELENEIEKSVLFTEGDILEVSQLNEIADENSFSPFENLPVSWKEYANFRRDFIIRMDKKYVESLLAKTSGNMMKASKLAGINRLQLYRFIKPKHQ